MTFSRDQFASLVAEHQGAVCAVAYSALRDRAASEEIAQEAFLLAWRKLPELTEPPKMPAWVCGIARNLAKNARRRAGRMEPSDSMAGVASDTGGPLDQLLDKETDALVARALGTLSEDYREPLVLFYRHDRSVRQVADALEISEATAKQRLSRGREKLADAVRDIVERALRSSGPGAAFTAGVLASIASLPDAAAAQVAPRARPASAPKWAGSSVAALAGGALAVAVAGGAAGWMSAGSTPGVQPSAPVTTSTAGAPRAAPAAGASDQGSHYRRRPARGASSAAEAARKHDGNVDIKPEISRALDRKIDLVLNEVAPSNILKLLGDVAQTPIIVRGELPSDVSMNVHAVTVRQALDETLERAGGVWEDVDLIRVVGTPGPAGPRLEGPPLDLTLDRADFVVVLTSLGESLEMPVWMDGGLAVPPVTIQARSERAGAVLARIVKNAGLRYEIVPAIEVRPGDDDEDE